MTDLKCITHEKTNDNEEGSTTDIYNDTKASLLLSINENKTEAKTTKKVEVEKRAFYNPSEMKIDVKTEYQSELKEVWDKSYNMLSKLTSEELISLYFNLTNNTAAQSASKNLSKQIPNSNISTDSSFMETNALFNFESSKETSQKKQCCTCKHSNCLKLYCACIRQKGFCGNDCKCKECYNKQEFEEIRNKSIQLLEKKRGRAFKSVIIELEDGTKAHAYGCRCTNSNCEKNYCQCFSNKVKCTHNCKCSGCANCN